MTTNIFLTFFYYRHEESNIVRIKMVPGFQTVNSQNADNSLSNYIFSSPRVWLECS